MIVVSAETADNEVPGSVAPHSGGRKSDQADRAGPAFAYSAPVALDEPGDAVRRTDVTVKTTQEMRDERREAARRKGVTLKVALVTLSWLVSVPLLIGWELTGSEPLTATEAFAAKAAQRPPSGGGAGYLVAAVLMVLLPFVAGVIATKNRRFFVGGAYVVLTLAMVLPALSVAGRG